MSSAPLLLDTNIISSLMREPTGVAAQRMAQVIDEGQKVLTSVVVQCELEFGLAKRPSARLSQAYDIVMRHIEVATLDEHVVNHYAKVRNHLESSGQAIGANDNLIAAHALALGASLVTDNETEFRRVPGLTVENWLR